MMATAARARGIELGDAFEGGVGVVEIVVGELLALHLARGGDARSAVRRRTVEGRRLVRVLAIAHGLGERAAEGAVGRASSSPICAANQLEIAAS